MSLRVVACGEVNPCGVAGAEASLHRAFSRVVRTRSGVIYPWPARSAGKTVWRREPTRVENLGDELWVGVKGQSNSVIAGSPRNAFRCSVACFFLEVEHWMGSGADTLTALNQTP